MALTYTSTIQTQIAVRLHNQTYSNLQSTDKTAIDGTWASGDPGDPGGHAGDALTLLRQYANFVELSGQDSGSGPDAWNGWFIAETVWRASTHMAPDREPVYRRVRDSAVQSALSAFSREDTDTVTGTEGLAFSRLAIRRRIMARCVALQPILLARPESIDQCIRQAVSRVWDMKAWSWRRVSDTIIFGSGATTNPTVTYGSTVTPDSIYTRRLYFTSPSSVAGQSIIYVPEDEIQNYISQSLDAGQPRFFNVFSAYGGGLTWFIDRDTDQAYTVRGVVLKKKPDLSTAGGVDTALGAMPDEAKDVVFNLALAYTWQEHARRDGYAIQAEAMRRLEDLSIADSVGVPTAEHSASMTQGTVAGMSTPSWDGGVSIGGML